MFVYQLSLANGKIVIHDQEEGMFCTSKNAEGEDERVLINSMTLIAVKDKPVVEEVEQVEQKVEEVDIGSFNEGQLEAWNMILKWMEEEMLLATFK